MEARAALIRAGGISDRRTLMAACTRRTLERAVADGVVIREAYNVYQLPDVDEARVAARRAHGVVSHLSAAQAHGWKVRSPPSRPSITVPRNGHPAVSGVRLHWGDVDAESLAEGVTDPARTVVDCARTLPLPDALSVADSALRAGLNHAVLLEAAAASPRTGRSTAHRVIAWASGRAANPFESSLRAIALGVDGFEAMPQCPVESIGHCDVGDAELRIALEAESHEYHAGKDAFAYDCRRYTAMVCARWLVLRFTWGDVMHRPERIHQQIAAVVRARREDVRLSAPTPRPRQL